MLFDFVLANVILASQAEPVDIGVRDGLIAAIAPKLERKGQVIEGAGNLLFPGFVDCHIHLDKAGILGRFPVCSGTLEEAVATTRAAKAGFTEDDVYARAAAVIESAISHGTTAMRSFAEVDDQAGLRSLAALLRLRADYADAIDLEICAFAQDGTTGIPGSLDLLAEAMQSGADLVGGCPYTDSDPERHIGDIFDLAERFDTAVDFHVDFTLDPNRSDLPAIVAETRKRGYAGRVALGHVTNLSMLTPEQLAPVASSLSSAGLAVVALPATDLFLTGRDRNHAVPRGLAPLAALANHGVTTAIATNNVLNPFTPFGNANLMRMADLYMHAAQLRSDIEVEGAFSLITTGPAAILDRPYALRVGMAASFVLLDAADPVSALRTMSAPLAGWFKGRQTSSRAPAQLLLHGKRGKDQIRIVSA
jgi:cytosine/creatinine deaminase